MGHWSGFRPVFCYSINTGALLGLLLDVLLLSCVVESLQF